MTTLPPPHASHPHPHPTSPLSAQLDEYESFKSRYWASVHEHTQEGALELDDLEQGSALEACYLLAKMQEDKGMLNPKVGGSGFSQGA